MATSPTTFNEQHLDADWLDQVLLWILPPNALIASGISLFTLITQTPGMGPSLVLMWSLVIGLTWARYMLRRQRVQFAIAIMCGTLMLFGIYEIIFYPASLPHASSLPLLSLILALLHLSNRYILRLIVIVWLVSLGIFVLPILITSPLPTSNYSPALAATATMANLTVIIVVLGRYRSRVFDLLQSNQSTQQRLEALVAERTAAMQTSEARYQAIAALASDYAFGLRIEPDQRIVTEWATNAFSQMIGYTLSEFDAQGGITQIAHPEDRPIVHLRKQRILAGQSDVSEFRIMTRQGEVRWMHSYTLPQSDPHNGQVVRAIGVMHDITERKSAEDLLRDSEERYRSLVELSPDAILIYADWRIVYANQSAALAFGFDQPEALLGASVIDYIHPDDRPIATSQVQQIVAQGGIAAISEVRIVRPDGTIRSFESTGTRFYYRGQPSVLSVSRDITQRKKEEEERRQLERRLLDSQKLESLGLMAGGIAHDFNNLLVGILGNASFALEDLPADSPLRETLDQIILAAKRAADLTRQMLAYAGRANFDMQFVNINTLMQDLGRLLRASVDRQLILDYQLDPTLPFIEVDPSQITQVVFNLIVNAAEAIGDKSGIITIRTTQMTLDQDYLARIRHTKDLPPGPYVMITVQDNGCGMAETTMERIFDPFFTTKFTGRGLGLAAVLGIMRSHRGAIHVESKLQYGTTFTVFLPAVSGQLVDL